MRKIATIFIVIIAVLFTACSNEDKQTNNQEDLLTLLKSSKQFKSLEKTYPNALNTIIDNTLEHYEHSTMELYSVKTQTHGTIYSEVLFRMSEGVIQSVVLSRFDKAIDKQIPNSMELISDTNTYIAKYEFVETEYGGIKVNNLIEGNAKNCTLDCIEAEFNHCMANPPCILFWGGIPGTYVVIACGIECAMN